MAAFLSNLRVLAWGASILLLITPIQAQVTVPVAGEFQINAYTTGSQDQVTVAADPSGTVFVAAWRNSPTGGSSPREIAARRFQADGTPLGDEIEVNAITADSQSFPSVARGSNGDFVVAWQSLRSAGNDNSLYSIQARRFASDGTAIGDDFQANTVINMSQRSPQVDIDAAGGFVIVWSSETDSVDSDAGSIKGQRFHSDGSQAGIEFLVNTTTSGSQGGLGIGHALDVAADGSFIVTWASAPALFATPETIHAQRFDADGNTVGGELQVATGAEPAYPSVAWVDGGGFVVVWQDGSTANPGPDGDQSAVRARLFDSSGSPVANEPAVNQLTLAAQDAPSVTAAADGGFVVAWNNRFAASDPDGSVRARRYDSTANATSPEFQVNSFTSGFQRSSSPRSLGFVDADHLVVVWSSGDSLNPGPDGDNTGVVGQRFSAAFFADGFESGDTTGWSSSQGF